VFRCCVSGRLHGDLVVPMRRQSPQHRVSLRVRGARCTRRHTTSFLCNAAVCTSSRRRSTIASHGLAKGLLVVKEFWLLLLTCSLGVGDGAIDTTCRPSGGRCDGAFRPLAAGDAARASAAAGYRTRARLCATDRRRRRRR
jgi:hypothetical protein